MSDGGVNGVFGNVSFDSFVVHLLVHISSIVVDVLNGVFGFVLRKLSSLNLHFMSGLPRAGDSLANPPHGLCIARNNANRSHIMQYILRRNGLRTNPTLRKADILLKTFIQMMTHHEHIQMLIHGIPRVWTGGVGAAGQHVGFPRHTNDIGCVSSTGSLGVIRVDGSIFGSGDASLAHGGFVEGIGVDGDLNVVCFCHGEAVIDGGWCGTPILMQLQTAHSSQHLIG
mmetsp:Transcript_16537/g.24247  ORF Transcript_16537/g.24247 Transcript_16537/m.24247 type:complete len:227 (-) Transcript_16537:16-696(-)